MGINPGNIANPAYQRPADIMRQYESLRHSNYFDERVKEKLRVPWDEFTLVKEPDGESRFYRAHYDKHKMETNQHGAYIWGCYKSISNTTVESAY